MCQDGFFQSIRAGYRLPPDHANRVLHEGFAVLPGVVPTSELRAVQDAYDEAMAYAEGNDLKVGSSTDRLNGLANQGPTLQSLCLLPPLLAAACQVIGAPFRLSSMLGRTLRPHTRAQDLHTDLGRDSDAFPMVGFILMVDDFRADNGATRIVPRSHLFSESPADCLRNLTADVDSQELALGSAGSALIFNASVWHGHTANQSDWPRRSIQGYFVPRTAGFGSDSCRFFSRETLGRMSPLAKYVCFVEH